MRRLAHYILIFSIVAGSSQPVLRGLAQEPKAHAGKPAVPPDPNQVAPVGGNAPAAKPPTSTGATTPTDPYTALVRSFFDDQDPLILYFALPALTFMRFIALFDLFNSVPNAWKAGAELANWKFNATERAKIKETIKAMRTGAAGQVRALEKTGKAYQERLDQVEVLFRELKGMDRIASDRKTRERLYDALEVWQKRGEFAPLASFVKAERNGRLRFADGKAWLQKFDLWQSKELGEAKQMVDSWNDLVTTMNKGLAVGEQKPLLHLEDIGRNRNPGELYQNGINRMKTADAAKTANDLCEQVFKNLLDRRMEFRAKVGLGGLIHQGQKMIQPLGSVGFSGLVFWLHARAYVSSIDRYGKAPEKARAEIAQAATIENAVNLRAESSLDSQVARRKEEFSPFTDAVVDTMQDHQEELMTAVKEYMRANPGSMIDLNSKRAMLLDKEQLRAKVLAALPFAAQRLGKDPTVPQILSFLALAEKPDTAKVAEEDHKRFLNALYGRVLNNMFSEIEQTMEVDDNLITVGASQQAQMSKVIKGALTPSTLTPMKKMKIVVPDNVAPLPVLPEKRIDTQPGAAGKTSALPKAGDAFSTASVQPDAPPAARPGIDLAGAPLKLPTLETGR